MMGVVLVPSSRAGEFDVVSSILDVTRYSDLGYTTRALLKRPLASA